MGPGHKARDDDLARRTSSSADVRPSENSATDDDVEDRRLPVLDGGQRVLQRALQVFRPVDAAAVETEVGAELVVVGAVDRHPVVEISAGRGAIGIVMDVATF